MGGRGRARGAGWGAGAGSQVIIHVVGPVLSRFSSAQAVGSVEVEKRIHPINRSIQAAKGETSQRRLVGQYLSSGSKPELKQHGGSRRAPSAGLGESKGVCTRKMHVERVMFAAYIHLYFMVTGCA